MACNEAPDLNLTAPQQGAVHPAQRDYGVDVFALKAGDIISRDGEEYRVNDGFDSDSSSCWRDSRWVQCTLLTGTYDKGALRYVDPCGALARCGGAA